MTTLESVAYATVCLLFEILQTTFLMTLGITHFALPYTVHDALVAATIVHLTLRPLSRVIRRHLQ